MKMRLITTLLVFAALAGATGCSKLFPKSEKTWYLVLQVQDAGADREAVMKQTIDVISERLRALGVTDFEIQRQGDPSSNQIMLRLPTVPDPERLKRFIAYSPKLELVRVLTSPFEAFNSEKEAVDSLGGTVPADRQVLPYTERGEMATAGSTDPNAPWPEKWVIVERPPVLEGKDLSRAEAVPEMRGNDNYSIRFTIKAGAAQKFGEWTGANIGQHMGTVLDGKVKSIATIQGRIFDSAQITGRFTKDSAEDLAHVLNSGDLPAPVQFVEEGMIKRP